MSEILSRIFLRNAACCGWDHDGRRTRTRWASCWRPSDSRRRLPSLIAQFKPDCPARLLLPDGCSIRRVTARGNIIDPDRNDIAATELAVDRQIEHGQVAGAAFDLEFCPDGPDVFGPQWWLRSSQLPLFHDTRLGARIAFT